MKRLRARVMVKHYAEFEEVISSCFPGITGQTNEQKDNPPKIMPLTPKR